MAGHREAALGHLPAYTSNLPCAGRGARSGLGWPRGCLDVASDLREHVAQGDQTHGHIDSKSRYYRSFWESRTGNNQLGLEALGRCL